MQTMKDKMSSMMHTSVGEKREEKTKDWSPGYPIQE
jgi:hypothetical protein